MRPRMLRKLFYYVVFAIFSASIAPTPLWAEPSNLGLLKKELIQYHDSGAYLQEIQKVSQEATQYINQEVQNNAQNTHPKKLAIVLDIDETSLSNFTNMKTIDFANLPDKINQQ